MTTLPLHDDWQHEIGAAYERNSDNHVCTVGELAAKATRGIDNILLAVPILVVANGETSCWHTLTASTSSPAAADPYVARVDAPRKWTPKKKEEVRWKGQICTVVAVDNALDPPSYTIMKPDGSEVGTELPFLNPVHPWTRGRVCTRIGSQVEDKQEGNYKANVHESLVPQLFRGGGATGVMEDVSENIRLPFEEGGTRYRPY